MSEYQYYEFVAIDRPLTAQAQEELRALSSRAQITATRFVNTYHYGDFRGDPAAVLARYFDAAVYVSNFGIRRVAFRLPRESLDADAVRPYLCGSILMVTTTREHTVLTFEWRNEEGGGWIDEGVVAAWLSALLPLRTQLLRGDIALLYIPWLHHARKTDFDTDRDHQPASLKEPPVPAGLRTASAALRSLAEFFEIDEDLFAAAAENSADDVAAQLDPDTLGAWIAKRPVREKDELLTRVAAGEGPRVEAELLRAFADQRRAAAGAPKVAATRTFAQITARSEVLAEQRKREMAANAERDRIARARVEAIAREKRIDVLASRVPAAWTDIDGLIAQQKAPAYDQAVAVLLDLRALANREDDMAKFDAKLRALRERNAGKAALHRRLREQGLSAKS